MSQSMRAWRLQSYLRCLSTSFKIRSKSCLVEVPSKDLETRVSVITEGIFSLAGQKHDWVPFNSQNLERLSQSLSCYQLQYDLAFSTTLSRTTIENSVVFVRYCFPLLRYLPLCSGVGLPNQLLLGSCKHSLDRLSTYYSNVQSYLNFHPTRRVVIILTKNYMTPLCLKIDLVIDLSAGWYSSSHI